MNQVEPKLRFSIDNLPWLNTSLSDVASLVSGTHLSPTEYSTLGKVPYFTGPSDITDCIALVTKFTDKDTKISRRGEVLITVKGSGVGKTQICKLDRAFLGRQLMSINATPVLNVLVQAILEKNNHRLEALAMGNMIPGLSRNDILSFKVSLPKHVEEQIKIADFLTSVDTKISQLTEKHRLLKEYKKGVMQQVFSQIIRFKDENGNEFPEWELFNGDRLFKAISNKKHNSELPILAITQEHGAIPRELINYQVQVTDNSISGYKVVEKGDFIISLRSFQGGIEYSEYKGICSPAYIILRPRIEVDDAFYRYYLKTYNFIQEMKKRLEGIRDGKILSYKYFSEIILPYPCAKEQRKIALFFQSIDRKIEAVTEQIEQTKQFKKGLLQQMFV
ncbi:restriction endonuclease subunit S [Vibrio splendidus]|uniref:Type I restriction modification DNA specificity domain-containing protein n=1 Tax=Vibrio splendidus TaxID=29497 RepID=A0A2N7CI16_VIBSP|nr:restriction endonuclease subunit S [Vibrio splendidus]PMF27483.1 hypothetical protein BCV19_24925 [Vibrio splendidus]